MRFFFGSLRRKLVLAVTVLLVAGIASVVWISTQLQVRDSRMFMLKSASDAAAHVSSGFRAIVQQTLDRSRSWALQVMVLPEQKRSEKLKLLMQGDPTLRGIRIWNPASHLSQVSAFQAQSLEQSDVNPSPVWTDLKNGELSYRKVEFGASIFHEVVTPLSEKDGNADLFLIAYFDPSSYHEIFKSDGLIQVYLYDSQGRVLQSSDQLNQGHMMVRGRLPSEIVNVSVSSALNNGQLRLQRENQQAYIGSYARTGVGDLHAVVLVNEERVFDTPRKIALRSIYLGAAILSLSLVFAVFFADSITRPVLSLVEAAHRIREGDFSVRARATTRDEIRTLTTSFNEMATGLAERERLKTVFGKFHSKAVAEKLMNEGAQKLGGERIPVTVFFSDIRSFTSTSESMAPEQVVEMLNEYMTEMVAVIEKYDGVVDKYVGDAIMAVWGMPNPEPEKDADKALRACLEMRERLKELNERRHARGQPPIKIGMGLNSGEVIAGNIGSQSRMEYTVIGDTVNTASRMESLTKELKTDLLLNESTYQLLPSSVFEFEGPMETHAKGKSETLLVYGCRGLLSAASEDEFEVKAA